MGKITKEEVTADIFQIREEEVMSKVAAFLKRIHSEESGQDLIEYALLAALIALGAILGMGAVASGINSAFSAVASKLTSAVS